jgi:4-aminobutyrate aminotransferase-like enzyme
MSELAISETMLKRAMKEALVEVLEERREYVRDILEEVLEEFELIEDIREVKKADRLYRSVFSVREGEA